MPKQLADLSSSVANLGSQIQDLRGTATQLQTQSSNAATNITILLVCNQLLSIITLQISRLLILIFNILSKV
jgi:hypothetical protein